MTDLDRATEAPASVVVCAYTERRFADTLAAIESVVGQSVRPLEILVVVDHNPTLAVRLRRAAPEAEVVASTGPPGLSGARNTGIARAKGSIVAFLDDDAVADPRWLARITGAFADPAVVAVGGRATPRWPGLGRPGWFPTAFDWVVGCSFPGQPDRTAPVRNLMGCNMAFRSTALERSGGFSQALGRVGRVPLGCEETELCIRMRRSVPGGIILFDPDIVVDHAIGPERTSPSYFLRRCFGEGISKAAVTAMVGVDEGLETERRYLASVLPRAALEAGRQLVTGNDASAAGRLLALLAGVVASAAGYLVGRLPRRGARDARRSGPESGTSPTDGSQACLVALPETAERVRRASSE